MTGLIPLLVLLSAIGAPPIEGADSLQVEFRGGYDGLRGVACLSEWAEVEGHAQDLCDGAPDGTIVVFTEAIPDMHTLAMTLAHEACHFNAGVNPEANSAWERFNEAKCYAAGKSYGLRYSQAGEASVGEGQ